MNQEQKVTLNCNCGVCQDKKNCELKGDLSKKYHSKEKLLQEKIALQKTIQDRKVVIQCKSSLLYIYNENKIIIVRLFQLNRQLKKLYQIKTSIKKRSTTLNLLPMENSVGFVIKPLFFNQVNLYQLQKNKQWLITRTLGNQQYQGFHKMMFNQKEDFLIISGKETYILEKQNNWNVVCILNFEEEVSNLSLNEEQMLICQSISKVFILQKNQNRWTLLQRIDYQEKIEKALFITNEIFVVYPQLSRQFYIYKLNEMKSEFMQIEQIQVHGKQNGNIQFSIIHELNILLAIIGRFINVFEIIEQGQINLKEILFWNTHRSEYLDCSKNFFVTQYANQKRGIVINKMKSFD